MTTLAPELTIPSSELVQYLSNPREEHREAFKKLVGCINGKHYQPLAYRTPNQLSKMSLVNVSALYLSGIMTFACYIKIYS
jgi:hypothetical protein